MADCQDRSVGDAHLLGGVGRVHAVLDHLAPLSLELIRKRVL